MSQLTATKRNTATGMRKIPRAVVVQSGEMTAFMTGSAPTSFATTTRKKKKGKHTTTTTSLTATGSLPPSLARNMPSPSSARANRLPPSLLPPVPFPGNQTSPRNEILSNAYASPTSQGSTEVTPKPSMPPAALYGIIAAGSVFLILAFIFACIFFKRRKRQDRQTADWYGVQEKYASDAASGESGDGLGIKEKQLSDNDSYIEDENDYDGNNENSRAPVSILSKFPKLTKQNPNTATHEKPMEISKPYGMNFHVTNPDNVPVRPPRPSAHIDLSTSPQRALLKTGHDDDDDEEEDLYDSDDQEAYERNILALTTSMAFDTPRDRQSRAFDPAMPMPDSADLGSSMRDGRDTIVGFAESYGALASPLLAQEEAAPIRPLHIRNPSTATSRSKRPYFNRTVDDEHTTRDRNKVSEIPPTLSHVDLGLAASETTSMRELEDVLGSFGRSGGTPLEKENPLEAKQMTSGGATFTLETNKPAPAASKIPAYKLNKPAGVERGLSVVRNALSIQSTIGEVFEASPTYNTLPSFSTSPNLSNISHNDSNETLVEATSGFSSKRVSFALDKAGDEGRSLADTGRVQSLAELVRSKSLKRFNSSSDLNKGDLRGAFEQMDNTTLPDTTDLYRPSAGVQAFGARVRSSSFHGLSPALHAGWRADRQRTSTAYGGQMPPTPLLATPLHKDKRKTTDSEARFALGSHMLSVLDSPGGPEQATPSLPYLRSPDLRIQPPSPSQASEITTFSAMDRERDYHDRLAQQGFAPLGQMSLSSGNSEHSQYYRSPIDSIVGVFEFDDPHHSAVINSISLR